MTQALSVSKIEFIRIMLLEGEPMKDRTFLLLNAYADDVEFLTGGTVLD